jgi:hypothetical protein
VAPCLIYNDIEHAKCDFWRELHLSKVQHHFFQKSEIFFQTSRRRQRIKFFAFFHNHLIFIRSLGQNSIFYEIIFKGFFDLGEILSPDTYLIKESRVQVTVLPDHVHQCSSTGSSKAEWCVECLWFMHQNFENNGTTWTLIQRPFQQAPML